MKTFRNRLKNTIFTGSLVVAMLSLPLPVFAVDMIPDATLRASEFSGNLANITSQDFFTIEPAQNDSEVTLTLTFGSQNDARVANNVNFRLFDQTGMRNLQDGEKASIAAFGGGDPIFGKDDNYKVGNTFKVSGRQGYSVMVYSTVATPVNYTLRANMPVGRFTSQSLSPKDTGALIDSAATIATTTKGVATIPTVNTNRQISGQSKGNGDRQYYTLKAISNDEEVTLTFDYTLQGNESLTSEFNFYVFSTDKLSQLEAGGRLENVNLAAGNLVKVDATKLSATFRSVGNETFTVIVANRSNVSTDQNSNVTGADFQ